MISLFLWELYLKVRLEVQIQIPLHLKVMWSNRRRNVWCTLQSKNRGSLLLLLVGQCKGPLLPGPAGRFHPIPLWRPSIGCQPPFIFQAPSSFNWSDDKQISFGEELKSDRFRFSDYLPPAPFPSWNLIWLITFNSTIDCFHEQKKMEWLNINGWQ